MRRTAPGTFPFRPRRPGLRPLRRGLKLSSPRIPAAWLAAPRLSCGPSHILRALGLAIAFAVTAAHAQQIRFQPYSDEQGLGNLAVTAIVQDRIGFILVGTESGLYRYDSVGFTPAAGVPAAQRVDGMHTDHDGRTWAALGGSLYASFGGGFSKVASAQPIPIEASHRLAMLGGDIVVSTGGTVLRASLNPQRVGAFSPFFSPALLSITPALKRPSFLAADGSSLLIGCGDGVCRADAGHIEVFDTRVGLPADAWQVAIRSRDGTLWIRSLDRLAWQSPGAATFSVVAIPGSHTRYRTHPDTVQLLEDLHGDILTQTDDGLLLRTSRDWRPLTSQVEGHPEGTIRAMMFDREGLLWLGSRGGGVFRSLGYGMWNHWNTSNGLSSNMVWGIVHVPGQPVWVVTDADAAPLTGHSSSTQSLGGANFTTVATRRGRMWFAPLDAPLTRIDPASGTSMHVDQLGLIRTQLVDGSDRLWVGGKAGLFQIGNADAAAPIVQRETGLPRQLIFGIVERAPGEIWVLGDGAIYRRRPAGAWELMASSGILQGQPRSLGFRSPDELWVGTSSAGVLRFRVGSHLVPLSPLKGPIIGSNTIMFLKRDSRGWMWIGSDHGIDMFNGRIWRRFEKSCGPVSNDMDEGAVYEDIDGSMWFGTSRGLSHLLDPALLPTEMTLHPLITRVTLGERDLDLRSPLHLDWSREPLIVSFAALDFEHERSIQFRYRMLGVDAGWNNTSAHEVRYAGLPAGRLTFEVSAFDPVHGGVSMPTAFVIKIRAPWWHRWWCYALEGLAVCLIVVGAWQLRIRLLLRGQRLLEQMVQDRTREIEQARRELLLQATSDSLTGLSNRRAIMTYLEEAIVEARQHDGKLAVLLIDIDYFKKINDSWGHLAGDAVLQELGRRMRDSLDPMEAVGRYGGEEFLLVMPDPAEHAVVRTGRLRRQLTDTRFDLGDMAGPVTISGGLAWLRPEDSVLTLLARADAALYEAKRCGRNRIVAAPDAERGADGHPVATPVAMKPARADEAIAPASADCPPAFRRTALQQPARCCCQGGCS